MAEYIKVPAGVYDMVTRCMEQEFPDHVAIRYVAEDGKTVVEKKYREYAQDIRRMVAYLKAEVPDIKGQRIVLLSRNCYEFCVASYGIILAGGVLVTLNQKKTWDELSWELELGGNCLAGTFEAGEEAVVAIVTYTVRSLETS